MAKDSIVEAKPTQPKWGILFFTLANLEAEGKIECWVNKFGTKKCYPIYQPQVVHFWKIKKHVIYVLEMFDGELECQTFLADEDWQLWNFSP